MGIHKFFLEKGRKFVLLFSFDVPRKNFFLHFVSSLESIFVFPPIDFEHSSK